MEHEPEVRPNENMEAFKQTKRNMKSQLTRTLNTCTKLIEREEKDGEIIRNQLRKAEELFSNLEENYEKAVAEIKDDVAFQAEEKWMTEVEEKYWQVIPKVKVELQRIEAITQQAQQSKDDAQEKEECEHRQTASSDRQENVIDVEEEVKTRSGRSE